MDTCRIRETLLHTFYYLVRHLEDFSSPKWGSTSVKGVKKFPHGKKKEVKLWTWLTFLTLLHMTMIIVHSMTHLLQNPHNFASCFEFRHKMILEEFMTFHLQPVFWDSTDSRTVDSKESSGFGDRITIDLPGYRYRRYGRGCIGGTFFWIFFRNA